MKLIASYICSLKSLLFFMMPCKNKYIFLSANLQICQTVWSISYSLVSKINQGSCLGCLGGDDAPDAYDISSSHLVRNFGHMFVVEFGLTGKVKKC